MSSVQASCPTCGDIELRPVELSLVIYQNARDDSHYSFRCSSCDQIVRKRAGAAVIRLLIMAGVSPRVSTQPAEATEPKRGPVLRPDDLVDFWVLMNRVDTLSALCEVPAEASEKKVGPPLTYDDLLDFAISLLETDDLTRVAARSSG